MSNINLIIVSIILYFISLIEGQVPQVPCVFFFGDSQFDKGNNNVLNTNAKADYFPYGIDYSDGSTGRFTNGKNTADFLAEYLGFSEPIPPFAKAKGMEIIKGVNYGSGAAGILDDTGKTQGGRISMNMQLNNHGITVSKIAVLLGNVTIATNHVTKCLYVVNIGANDYINNYLLPQYYPTSTMYNPLQFAAILANRYSQQLRTLYKYGARKVAVFGAGLVGCLPELLSSGNCIASYNNMVVQFFNDNLKLLIQSLNNNFHNAQFIFINSISIASANPSTLGIKVTNASCCMASKTTGLCEVGTKPCNNRNEFYFWDNFHPTEIAYRATSARAYSALLPSDAYPMDIRTLLLQ